MLKAYASYFVAYLLDNLKDRENIERIVLFGSVARNQATKDSDIDIFIEVKHENKKIKNEIKKLTKKFYESREVTLFRTRGVENKFSLKIGQLKGWKDLYKSIASTGIILYGPYEAKELPAETKHFIIIFWEKIGKNRGAFLNKLYGFKIKEKHYAGMLSKFDGKKLGKSCIMLPVPYKEDFFKILRKYKVKARIIEVFT